ncbi:hypothetical protein JOS77_15670 [Chromobacterium haemolyticum]|nr:hypothetical protein JOS77_15670 [Chromobacterium haemolyticum]
MKAWLSLVLLAAAAPAVADKPLTPKALAELVQCASFERYQALQPALLDVVFDKGPAWIRKNEKASSLGVYVYDLQQPIRVSASRRNSWRCIRSLCRCPCRRAGSWRMPRPNCS